MIIEITSATLEYATEFEPLFSNISIKSLIKWSETFVTLTLGRIYESL